LVRQEAKAQTDQELARMLREKEELEARLREIQTTPSSAAVITLHNIEYPDYWSKHKKLNHQSFDVVKGSAEWNKIEVRFHGGLPRCKILRIERNQNKNLWMWYFLKRQQLEQKNQASSGANERFIFHGSRANAYDIILKEGFDHRVANMGGAIGAGVYFAESSATSSGYVTGTGGTKKMLFCRVACGDIGPGASGLRRPPPKPKGVLQSWFGADKTEELYDSVGTAGNMYVIFDNHMAYPEYVIHY